MPVHIPPGGVPLASPMIISETRTHIIVAVEIAKTTLERHGASSSCCCKWRHRG